jgi:hypothetical protein
MEHSLVGTEVRTGSAKLFCQAQGQQKHNLITSDKAIMAQHCRNDAFPCRLMNNYQFLSSWCLQLTGHRTSSFAIRGVKRWRLRRWPLRRRTQVDTMSTISLVAEPEGSAFANTKVRRWTQSGARLSTIHLDKDPPTCWDLIVYGDCFYSVDGGTHSSETPYLPDYTVSRPKRD